MKEDSDYLTDDSPLLEPQGERVGDLKTFQLNRALRPPNSKSRCDKTRIIFTNVGVSKTFEHEQVASRQMSLGVTTQVDSAVSICSSNWPTLTNMSPQNEMPPARDARTPIACRERVDSGLLESALIFCKQRPITPHQSKTFPRYDSSGSSSCSQHPEKKLLSRPARGEIRPLNKIVEGIGIQYVDGQALRAFNPPPTLNFLQIVLSRLSSNDWRQQFNGLTDLRRLAKHHASLLTRTLLGRSTAWGASKRTSGQPVLQHVCGPLLELVDSLRSNVAKNAMMGLHDLYYYIGSSMNDSLILERMLSMCIRKAGSPGVGNFLIAEAERTLRQICLSFTSESKLLVYLLRNLKASRQNQKFKTIIGQCLCLVVLHLGSTLPKVLQPKDIKELAVSSVKRHQPKRVVLVSSCLARLVHKNVVENHFASGKLCIVALNRSLLELEAPKWRQIFSEAEQKEFEISNKLAEKTVDVVVVLGIPLNSLISPLTADGAQSRLSSRFELCNSTYLPRSLTPIRSGSTMPRHLQRNTSPLAMLSTPRPNYSRIFPYVLKLEGGGDSVLNTPRVSSSRKQSLGEAEKRHFTLICSQENLDIPRNISTMPRRTKLISPLTIRRRTGERASQEKSDSSWNDSLVFQRSQTSNKVNGKLRSDNQLQGVTVVASRAFTPAQWSASRTLENT